MRPHTSWIDAIELQRVAGGQRGRLILPEQPTDADDWERRCRPAARMKHADDAMRLMGESIYKIVADDPHSKFLEELRVRNDQSLRRGGS